MRNAPAPMTTALLLFALVVAVALGAPGAPGGWANLLWSIPAVLRLANEALLFYASLRSDEDAVVPGVARDSSERWTAE